VSQTCGDGVARFDRHLICAPIQSFPNKPKYSELLNQSHFVTLSRHSMAAKSLSNNEEILRFLRNRHCEAGVFGRLKQSPR
jgi:hypothetical protein